MSTQYRLIIRPELRRHLFALQQAARSQPGGLRDREFQAAITGLRALTDGREEEFNGRRLGYSPRHHDLRDCAEVKLEVISESRGDRDYAGDDDDLRTQLFEECKRQWQEP